MCVNGFYWTHILSPYLVCNIYILCLHVASGYILKSTTTWDVKYSTLLVEIKYTKKSVTLDTLCYLPDVLIADALLFTKMQ